MNDQRKIPNGFSLLELVITLAVAAILMVGMLPLVRMATQRGVQMQFTARNSCELQSILERMSAGAAQAATLDDFKTEIGTGTQANSYGSYYVHESEYIRFNSSGNEAASTNGAASGLLKLRVALTDEGPSIVRIFNG